MARPRTPPDQLNEIYPNLYLGDLTAAESPHVLEAYAITHVISLTSHRPKIPKDLAITKKHFRIRDNTTSNILGVLPECIARLEYILGDEDGGVDALGRRRRVLVHCRMGMSRSGGAVVAYVMKFAQCPATVALEYVRQMRPIVHPNRAFMAQLELWGACEYDTSFLEDHGKYVLPEAAEVDMDIDAGSEGAPSEEEDEEEDEEALLAKALEMSLAAEGEAGEEALKDPAAVWVDEVIEELSDVEMGEIPPPPPPTDPPPPPPSDPPATATGSDTSMSDPAVTVPLPPSPDLEDTPDTVLTQLEERRKLIQQGKLHATDADELPPAPTPADGEEWGMVVMQDGMKRCFEECLKDVAIGVV